MKKKLYIRRHRIYENNWYLQKGKDFHFIKIMVRLRISQFAQENNYYSVVSMDNIMECERRNNFFYLESCHICFFDP